MSEHALIRELAAKSDAYGPDYFLRDAYELHQAVYLLLRWVADQPGRSGPQWRPAWREHPTTEPPKVDGLGAGMWGERSHPGLRPGQWREHQTTQARWPVPNLNPQSVPREALELDEAAFLGKKPVEVKIGRGAVDTAQGQQCVAFRDGGSILAEDKPEKGDRCDAAFTYESSEGKQERIFVPAVEDPKSRLLCIQHLRRFFGTEIIQNDDGYFVFWPVPNNGGYYEPHHLRQIANTLEALNEPWHQQVVADLEKANGDRLHRVGKGATYDNIITDDAAPAPKPAPPPNMEKANDGPKTVEAPDYDEVEGKIPWHLQPTKPAETLPYKSLSAARGQLIATGVKQVLDAQWMWACLKDVLAALDQLNLDRQTEGRLHRTAAGPLSPEEWEAKVVEMSPTELKKMIESYLPPKPPTPNMGDALSDTWGLIANAWGGNWPDRDDPELGTWTRDAEAWRDHWLKTTATKAHMPQMIYAAWSKLFYEGHGESKLLMRETPEWREAFARWYETYGKYIPDPKEDV